MAAAMGNQNAVGNKGGGRKSKYDEKKIIMLGNICVDHALKEMEKKYPKRPSAAQIKADTRVLIEWFKQCSALDQTKLSIAINLLKRIVPNETSIKGGEQFGESLAEALKALANR